MTLEEEIQLKHQQIEHLEDIIQDLQEQLVGLYKGKRLEDQK